MPYLRTYVLTGDGEGVRAATWAEAEADHRKMVAETFGIGAHVDGCGPNPQPSS